LPDKRFRRLAIGGTFDRFHSGHSIALRKAFALSERVVIGVTSDLLASRQGKGHKVDLYSTRVDAVRRFLRLEGLDGRAEIMPINNRFGITNSDAELDAILVSGETYQFALEINAVRERRGLKKLEIVLNEKIVAEDGEPLSSTRIRGGEIDRQGRLKKTS
jgi:cytidyltransferase-like protein